MIVAIIIEINVYLKTFLIEHHSTFFNSEKVFFIDALIPFCVFLSLLLFFVILDIFASCFILMAQGAPIFSAKRKVGRNCALLFLNFLVSLRIQSVKRLLVLPVKGVVHFANVMDWF